jgi:tRNA guanosine-2'-O-methyltransferase
VKALIKQSADKAFNKVMTMPNSPGHKMKIRLWTVLILCTKAIDNPSIVDTEVIYKVLGLDTLPSIRNLIELFLSIMVIKYPEFITQLIEKLSDMNSRAQYLASLIGVAGNYLIYCPDKDLVDAWKKVGSTLLNYINIHQFAVRSIAQLFLHALLQRVGKLKMQSPHIYEALLKEPSFNISILKEIDNFLLKSFSVINWMSKFQDAINVGLWNMAYPNYLLNNVAPEGEANPYVDVTPRTYFENAENINSLYFSLFGCVSKDEEEQSSIRIRNNVGVPLRHPLEDLEHLFEGKVYKYEAVGDADVEWSAKFLPQTIKDSFGDTLPGENSLQQNQEILEKLNQISEPKNESSFQRKITPWTDLELSNEINPRLQQASRTRQPMIVMATYVDKIPNLAGLSRTCEIFAAEKLVMASLKVVNHDMFKSIAVTAQNWLPMDECMEEFVVPYLQSLRNSGYTIVGVEQTSTSIPIQQFTFPEKCVIVLGKEKEGIPAETIQAIDVCVEIPQFGMIRSLNVHVSASIVMYEYTKQRIMK